MSDLDIINKKLVPLCSHLRSKAMYVRGSMEEVDEEHDMVESGEGYFWCLQSSHQFGPDDEVVNREACKPGRSCFEPI